MVGLGETVGRLARMRRGSAEPEARGDAGMVEIRGFGFNPGELRMLSYLPPDLAARAPLVVVLHGCTQRGGAHARGAGWLALADRYGFAVLAPEQTAANNPNRCFNWFEPGDTARGFGECASIHAMVQHLVRTRRLDPERVFVTGLSAGGAMTAVLLASYPETFAAGAVIAGLPFGAARSMPEAFASMHQPTALSGRVLADLVKGAGPAPARWPRLAIWHGEADATVAVGNADALARQWSALHGLREAPDETRARRTWTRSTWRGESREVLIEVNRLRGLGHGTPLAAGGEDPLGEAGPFMLEAGVSATLEAARFWGLAPLCDADWETAPEPEAEPPSFGALGEQILAAVSPHVSPDVEQVISRAFRSAGLIRN